MFAVYP